ncbi:MAG: glycoside hydrolase family 19 protein [Paracoccaceae bacterium]|nr:MAG: glycoside hydrolase family 19 protein [Paracoccaceae bacterium]
MAADAVTDLGEIIKAAKRRPQSCAMLIGPDGPVIEAHPKKPVEMMRRAAKARGGGPKGAQGILTVEGKCLTLTCENDDVPASLPRMVRRFLAGQGFPLKVAFVLPSGGRMEDGEDEVAALAEEPPVAAPPAASAAPAAPAPPAPPVPPPQPMRRAAAAPPPPPSSAPGPRAAVAPETQAMLARRLAAAAEAVRGLPADGSGVAERLGKALALVRAALLRGDAAGAEAGLATIETALERLRDGPGMGAAARSTAVVPPEHAAPVRDLGARVTALAAAAPGIGRVLARAMLELVMALQLGNMQRAAQIRARVEQALQKEAPTATAAASVPGSVPGSKTEAPDAATETPDKVAAKAAKLKEVFPGVSDDWTTAMAEELTGAVGDELLSNPKRRAHFFGQVLQEVGARGTLSENLNYTPEALIATFKYFRDNPDDATKYGRTADHPADPEAIANLAYGGRKELGNGDSDSGDGWKYRGRGLIQLTGKAGYERFTKLHEEVYGEKVDFVADPDLLLQPKYAMRSALMYWKDNGLFEIADEGVTREASDRITAKVNKHTKSYEDRWKNSQKLDASGVLADDAEDAPQVPPPP